MSSTPRKRKNENDAPSKVVFCTPRVSQPRIPATAPPSTSTFAFLEGSTPVPAKRRKALGDLDINNIKKQHAHQAEERAEKRREEEKLRKAEQEKKEQDEREVCLATAFSAITSAGFPTLYSFVDAMLSTRDQHRSSQVSRMMLNHGDSIFKAIAARQPQVAHDWMISSMREKISSEARALTRYFRPVQHTPVLEILRRFSLKEVLHDAENMAPTIYDLLRHIGFPEVSDDAGKRRKTGEMILATTLCMLAKSRNDHATEFQTTMCIYFLACGVSKSIFNVLNHAGLTLSYTQAVDKLRQLSAEQLARTVGIARSKAFMLIWDNINMAFKVGEQRQDSKDHFDNGTTATLIPLFDVEYGALSLDLKPLRDNRRPLLDFTADDLIPDLETVRRTEEAQLWHIQDILYDAFPTLRQRFGKSIDPLPQIDCIPVHKTEQYPLPAMHIDKSTLDGTISVLDSIVRNTLKLTDEDIRAHGLIICAGDQLTMALLDKASASRRDDTTLLDNIGRYTEEQDGLFHMKMAAARSIANEFWGQPNSPSPWSLWRMNSLLGRKMISAGLKAKTPPPFRPVWELMLPLVLVANILDGFRLYCGMDSLDKWVADVSSPADVKDIATRVLRELCSARRVARLRMAPEKDRDMPFENICLFNRDCLHLRQFKYAIKRGDVGAILDVIAHWMLMFRGTGNTPKYADALFQLVMRLKVMKPTLRHAWLHNWLANLSGKVNGFKEMDLLQEHHNFWAKIIYIAKGSNRSWKWLAMVTVCIFALRDVIRKVQIEFDTPFNSTSHTSPSTEADVKIIREYLEEQKIQTYTPTRQGNDRALEARDLIACGSEYANKPSAFRNFMYKKVSATNHGVPESSVPVVASSTMDEDSDDDTDGRYDMGQDVRPSQDDLELDDEEFPSGLDADRFLQVAHEIADELSGFE